MRKYDNQKGRSMIEMLGVLAIVGVLSVAGIAGYSKAMGKYKINKVMDQVSTMAANVKTMFASTGSYADLKPASGTSTAAANSLGLIPEEMAKSGTVRNGLNGLTVVGPTKDGTVYGLGFYIMMDGITKEACTTLVTSDWGGSAGFKYLKATAGTAQTPAAAAEADTNTFSTVPTGAVTPATSQADLFTAAEGCGDDNAITWVFY